MQNVLRLYSQCLEVNVAPRGCNYGNGADEDPQDEKKSDVCQRTWSY